MKWWLLLVCVLWAFLSRVCFGSVVIAQDGDTTSDDLVQVNENSLTPTNFSAATVGAGAVSLTRATTADKNAQQSVVVKSLHLLSPSSSESHSGKISTMGVATPTSKKSDTSKGAMGTALVTPAAPTTTIPPPGSYSPPPHSAPPPSVSFSSSSQRQSSAGYTPPSISPTHTSTSCSQPTVTVTIKGPYCSATPTPETGCSSDCSSKIGLSLGISIPGTAIFTFLLTALSCLCCQRVKKKQSYIQLAPTVYFDEEEQD